MNIAAAPSQSDQCDSSSSCSPSWSKPNTWTSLFSVLVYMYFISVNKRFGQFLRQLDDDQAEGTNEMSPFAVVRVVIWDVGLVGLFFLFHSLLARAVVQDWLVRFIPPTILRSVYVLQASLLLHLVIKYWRPLLLPLGSDDGGKVGVHFFLWDSRGYPLIYRPLWLVSRVLGPLLSITSTFAIDHFELYGLSQACGVDFNKYFMRFIRYGRLSSNDSSLSSSSDDLGTAFVARWHYRYVAHPIMTAFLVRFWISPVMTLSHFVFSITNTVYILAAVYYLEEPTLRHRLGKETYDAYLRSVPRYFPNVSVLDRAKPSEKVD